MGGIPRTSQWGGVLSCSPNPDSRPYYFQINTYETNVRENAPGNFRCFTYGDKHYMYKLLPIKDITQRQRFNEDVFEASILCLFIVSFKRCYNEYLPWFFFTFCWSLNLLMSFFPSKTWLQISVCVCTSIK